MNDTFSNRLKKAMSLRGIKQVDLVRKTDIDKSLISNYVNGNYTAKQENIHTLAKVLNVDDSWLMGFDVPMERKDNIVSQSDIDKVKEIIRYSNEFDENTKESLINIIDALHSRAINDKKGGE